VAVVSLQLSSEQSVGDVGITQLDWKRVPRARSSGCKSSVAVTAECWRHRASRNSRVPLSGLGLTTVHIPYWMRCLCMNIGLLQVVSVTEWLLLRRCNLSNMGDRVYVRVSVRARVSVRVIFSIT